ncbi:MAG TPA: hypothetical protein VF779_00145 [Pyrinomonadaceae bacterium]
MPKSNQLRLRTSRVKAEIGLLLFLLFGVPANTFSQNERQTITASDLAGSYRFSTRFGGQVITFTGDGKFNSDAGDCTTEYASEGTYAIVDGVIVITIKTNKKWPHGQPEKAEQTEPSNDAENKDNARKEEVIRLLPIKWDERLYLISEDDVREFCNAINAGAEPRKSFEKSDYPLTDPYFGTFYLRTGDDEKAVKGLPQLPKAWLEYLLKAPLDGEVLYLDKNNEGVINIGKQQGLKVGMRLFVYSDSQVSWSAPSIWSGLEVISVDETLARVKIRDDVKAGDKISTKFRTPKLD